MAGLILIATTVIWAWICATVSRSLSNRIRWPIASGPLAILLFGSLFIAPTIDEIIGTVQFRRLCDKNGIKGSNLSVAAGKVVNISYGRNRTSVQGVALPTKQQLVIGRDAASGEEIFRYNNYYSDGGWLMRHTWIGMGSSDPMFFSGNGCGIAEEDRLLKQANISTIK